MSAIHRPSVSRSSRMVSCIRTYGTRADYPSLHPVFHQRHLDVVHLTDSGRIPLAVGEGLFRAGWSRGRGRIFSNVPAVTTTFSPPGKISMRSMVTFRAFSW